MQARLSFGLAEADGLLSEAAQRPSHGRPVPCGASCPGSSQVGRASGDVVCVRCLFDFGCVPPGRVYREVALS